MRGRAAYGEGAQTTVESRAGIGALVLAVTLLWGLNWPAMKLAVLQFEPWTFRVVSVLGAGATLMLLAWLSGEPVRLSRRLIVPHLVISFTGVTLWHMLTAYGLLLVGGGRAAIIAFTMPLWATLLSVVFLKERPSRLIVVALFLGMAGLGVLLGPELGRLGAEPLGSLLILLAAIAWAVQTVATKAFAWGIGTMALSSWQLLVGGVPILLVWFALGAWPDFERITVEGVVALLYVVFVALVFCFTAYLRIVRSLPAIVASLSTLAIPIVGVASSAWLLGEAVGARELLALCLVVAAIGLVLLPRTRGSLTRS